MATAELLLKAFVKSHLVIVDSSYRLDEEAGPKHMSETASCLAVPVQVEYSRSYPGLKTVYNIHTVKCRVKATRLHAEPDASPARLVVSGRGTCARMWRTRKCPL